MPAPKLDIIAVSGSLRRGSFNTALLRTAVAVAPEDVAIEIYDHRDMPRYGAFWYCTYQSGLTAELFISLLRWILRHRANPVHLVVDGLPAHKTALVKSCVASTHGRLTLHFLPGYMPQLVQPFFMAPSVAYIAGG